MKILSNIPNTPVSSDYPKGKIKDETSPGTGDGTPVNENVNGDIIQFFQKLVIDSTVSENDLPDNVTNGYQLITALSQKILNEIKPTATWQTSSDASHSALYRITKDRMVDVFIQFNVGYTVGTTIFTFPAGYAPVRTTCISNSFDTSVIFQTNGNVDAGANGATGEGSAYSFFSYPLD